MLELYFIRICSSLTYNGQLLSCLSDGEMEKIFTIKYTGSGDINAIDLDIKKSIDKIVLQYGIARSVIKVNEMLMDVRALKKKLQGGPRDYLPRTQSGIEFFILATKSIGEKLEKLYLPEVLAHLYFYMCKKTASTINKEYFIAHVLDEKISRESLLGITDDLLEEQILLPGFSIDDVTKEEDKMVTKPLEKAMKAKNKLTKEMVAKITALFSREAVEEAVIEIVDILNATGREELTVFCQLLLKTIDELEKDRPLETVLEEGGLFKM